MEEEKAGVVEEAPSQKLSVSGQLWVLAAVMTDHLAWRMAYLLELFITRVEATASKTGVDAASARIQALEDTYLLELELKEMEEEKREAGNAVSVAAVSVDSVPVNDTTQQAEEEAGAVSVPAVPAVAVKRVMLRKKAKR